MALKAKHAFGSSSMVEAALQSGQIDAYDILFLDGDTDPKIGWIDKNGNYKLVKNKEQIVHVEELPTADGDENVVYIYNDEAYIWNGEQCVSLSKPTDVTALEAKISTKSNVEYEVAYKPVGTLVDYRDKEIRIMCPADTAWTLQESGENADPLKYYIGFKAYAPEDAVNFKEDLGETIVDETMYSFEGNDFAGVDAYGRKFSIVWLPVAKYDEESDAWTYYGAGSSEEKYVGWYYSVEWYNADGVLIASDCIRINLSNEECHSSIESFYVSNAISIANSYTDTQIETKIAEMSSVEVVEF